MFREIYSLLELQIRQPVRQLCAKTGEFKPDFNLRPAPLKFNSSLIVTHQFYNQFSKYINSSTSAPEGIIYAQAEVNLDSFWLTEINNRGFNRDTNMRDFIMLLKDVASSKFPLSERRATLFDAK